MRTTEGPADVTPVDPKLVAAMVPSEMLHGDEIILMLVKPSPLFILMTSFRSLVVITLLGMLATNLVPAYISANTVSWTAALLGLTRLVWALLTWTSHTYMLTNHRIITIKGVLNVAVVATNLRKVQRTTLYLPWWQRPFGLGGIGISTAASANQYDATWVMISRPLQVHEALVAAINKVQ